MENYHVIDLVGEGSFGKVCIMLTFTNPDVQFFVRAGISMLLIGCQPQYAAPSAGLHCRCIKGAESLQGKSPP